QAGSAGEPSRLAEQTCLAHAGSGLDRHDATAAETEVLHERLKRRELGLTLEQRRPGRRRGVGDALEQRREYPLEARNHQLEEVLGTVDVLEPDAAEIVEPDILRQVTLDERRRRRGYQDLAAVPGIADPGGLVHGEADVPVAADRRLAGVESHADT